MLERRRRVLWSVGLSAATVIAGLAGGVTAYAVSGGSPVTAGSYGFAVKLNIGQQAACTGALVAPSWVITAKSCFAENGQPVVAGPPARPTLVTIGRTDLTTSVGQVLPVVSLVPRPDRDVVLARLAAPVSGIAPVPVAATEAGTGEPLRVVGYGRTATDWVPDKLHTAVFSVGTSTGTTVTIAGRTPAEASPCKGDAGGPALRETGGQVQLVALNSLSTQAGCFGSTATRPAVVEARVDNISDWITRETRPGTARLKNGFSDRCLVALASENANSGLVRQIDCAPFADQNWALEPTAEPDGGYHLRNSYSGRCLVAVARENSNGGPVRQFDCAEYADQIWDVDEAAGGGVRLRNRFSQRCLVVPTSNNVNNAQAVQNDCGVSDGELWHLVPVDEGGLIANEHTGRCLVAMARENVNAGPVRQHDCARFADQLWTLQPVSDGYRVHNLFSDRCLVVIAAENANGAPAKQFDCADYADQIWDIAISDSGFQLRNRHSKRCLTVVGDNVNAAQAVQQDCTAAPEQRWAFRTAPPA